MDPNLEEELVMEGRLTIAMNTHQEVCVLQLTGGVALLPEQVREGEKIERVRRRRPPSPSIRCYGAAR